MKSKSPKTYAAPTLAGQVTVIIPTRDSAGSLRRCLLSVKAQSYPVDEIVVVDGFSGDNTRDIASDLGCKVILASGTQAAARNIGLASSKGEYVIFLDSDQQLEDGVVEECISKSVKEGVDAVKIPELFVGANYWGRCSALWKNSMVKAWGSEGGIPRFYRRSIMPQSSAYKSKLRFWEDLELYQRMRRVARDAWCTGRVIHYEIASLRGVARKYLSYGRSVAVMRGSSAETPYKLTVKLTLSTALYILRNTGRQPSIFFGCLFQALLKSICAALGFLLELRLPKD